MEWCLTEDVEDFAAAAGPLLASRAAECTVVLTLIENLRAGVAPPPEAPLFAWCRDSNARHDRGVVGAALHWPAYELLLAIVPADAIEPLAEAMAGAGRDLPGVNGERTAASAFATAWAQRTGATSAVAQRQRLHRLAPPPPPAPPPPGRARLATAADAELLASWLGGFTEETGSVPQDHSRFVADRLSYAGLLLWEAGEPVSLGGRNRCAAGVARVGPIYTPPPHRGRGYAAAVTAAVTAQALDAGAREAVLFTDLANPTSNGIYARLGYVPLVDRLVLRFGPPDVAPPGLP